MNEEIGIAYIKNANQVKVTVNEFRGNMYVHLREYSMDGDTGVSYPTKSGYAILGNELDSVIKVLQEASEKIAVYYRQNDTQLSFNFEEIANEYESLV